MILKLDKIVISRTDSIGDVVLTLPMAGEIKKHFPATKIVFLGNTYTRAVIECCEHVDEVWEWAQLNALSETEQVNWLKQQMVNLFIHVFPNKVIARLAKKAGIPHRVGTSHRAYHWMTCNHRPNFTRKNSDLHEAQLNMKLLAPMGIEPLLHMHELTVLAGFTKLPTLPLKFEELLSSQKKNVILHCKSKGSAVEWGVEKFIQLAQQLNADFYEVFFTGTEAEATFFRHLLPAQPNIHDLSGKMSLTELIAFIAAADVLVAASTGPLHIAGAADINTIGLFSSVRPIHAGRWQPLGSNTQLLIDKKNTDLTQPLAIDLRDVKKVVEKTEKK